jgi:hypothetical protein
VAFPHYISLRSHTSSWEAGTGKIDSIGCWLVEVIDTVVLTASDGMTCPRASVLFEGFFGVLDIDASTMW